MRAVHLHKCPSQLMAAKCSVEKAEPGAGLVVKPITKSLRSHNTTSLHVCECPEYMSIAH